MVSLRGGHIIVIRGYVYPYAQTYVNLCEAYQIDQYAFQSAPCNTFATQHFIQTRIATDRRFNGDTIYIRNRANGSI